MELARASNNPYYNSSPAILLGMQVKILKNKNSNLFIIVVNCKDGVIQIADMLGDSAGNSTDAQILYSNKENDYITIL